MPLQVRLFERGASPEQLREIAINQTEFLIGRGADCDLRLRESAVSRHHCIIRVAADEVALLDLGSSNGTYLNNERLRSQMVLRSGDEIKVGACSFIIDVGDHLACPPTDVDPLTATHKMRPPPQ